MSYRLNIIRRDLLQRGLVPENANWIAMSGGRSNEVWRVGGDLVCKLYLAKDNPLFGNSARHEFLYLSALSDANIAPQPVGFHAPTLGDVVLYKHLNGSLWSAGVEDVGWARIAARGDLILAGLAPKLRNRINAARPEDRVVSGVKGRFVHGDVVPANIIKTSAGLRLIDWQSPASGDLFCFLSPAMQSVYGNRPLAEQQCSDFLQACSDQSTVSRLSDMLPILHWQMAACCGWRIQKGDTDYTSGLETELAALEIAERQYTQTGHNRAKNNPEK